MTRVETIGVVGGVACAAISAFSMRAEGTTFEGGA
jgi:hypothetical protein